MANHQLLDNITHQDVRVITDYRPDLEDNHSYARLMFSELRAAQAAYPIFLRKNSETGQFEIIAMLGLAEQENLFVSQQGWQAPYIPLTVQRRPFLIGFQSSTDPSEPEEQPVVHIDMDSPRVNTTEGESVFLPQGGQSPYLQHISSVLQAIHRDAPVNEDFVEQLQQFALLEAVDLKVQLDNGENIVLDGLYTIQEDNLRTLAPEQLAALHAQGYLEAIYMIVASVHNMTTLIQLKNQQG